MNTSLDFKKLYQRDLEKLRAEIAAYEREEDLWSLQGEIKNSAGNLAMHLCGNLQYFIGTVLADSGYQRDREFEFGGRKSREEIFKDIDDTLQVLDQYFDQATIEDFQALYPMELFGYEMTTFYFVTHLLGHLNYHLGQVNYHRRILQTN